MAAGATYVPIATTTLGSAAASYTFSSIPSTYTDLVLISSVKTVSAGSNLTAIVNSDTGTNYSATYLTAQGSSAASLRYSNQTALSFDNYGYPDTTIFNINITHFMNYSNTTTYKTILSRANNANNGLSAVVNLWRSTAAITTINISSANTFAIGSTFTLYGIAAA